MQYSCQSLLADSFISGNSSLLEEMYGFKTQPMASNAKQIQLLR